MQERFEDRFQRAIEDRTIDKARGRRGCGGGRSPIGGIAASVIIILIGTAMLLDNFGIVRARDLWNFAPVLLVAFGVFKLLESEGRPGGMILGGVLVAWGGLWLGDNFGYIRFDPSMVWALILIGLGVSMLIRTLERQRLGAPSPGNTASDVAGSISQWAFFAGTKRTVSSPDFRSGEAVSIFSGLEFDLRAAGIEAPQAVFDTTAIFGGIELRVPQTWRVSVQGIAVFGAYEDKTLHPATGPELVITGHAIFGGVSIKN